MNHVQPNAASHRWSALASLAALLILLPTVRAVVFQYGEFKGSFDTTVSFGTMVRVQAPDPILYGTANGGLENSVNGDDGDLNYHRGLVSALLKASHDLQVDYRNMGVFVRGYYFNDFVNSDGNRSHIALTSDAKRIVAEGGELLDAYVYFKPTLGDMPASIRIGKQVLSWGESTFIPNGINAINPIDVAKLRTPGSELKEALLPINMVSGSLSITSDLTAEAFYLLDWQRTRIDPPGTYFSTNDFVAQGGQKVYLGFGAIKDTATLGAITRASADRTPGKSGQWGVNLKYIAHGLGDTEFGIYALNYHSRLPMISAVTPTSPISATVVQSTATSLGVANLLPSLVPTFGASSGTVLSTLLGAALTGVPASALPASMQPYYAAAAAIASTSKTVGLLTAAQTGHYVIEFPKDIKLYGASFNTSIKGVALQGEVSYRQGQPLQIDDVELLYATLSSLTQAVPFGKYNQIGDYYNQLGTNVQGWRRHNVWTGQMTATEVTRGILGAQQSTFIVEAGFVDVNLPDKNVLRYDAPGTATSGNQAAMTYTGYGNLTAEPASAFADSFSWGYQVVGKLDYNNLFHGVNMSPLVVLAHDVSGNTPLPLGNFRHDRKTVTIGADFTFQNAWSLEVRYVAFFGAGKYNLLEDRDYVSTTLKYSF